MPEQSESEGESQGESERSVMLKLMGEPRLVPLVRTTEKLKRPVYLVSAAFFARGATRSPRQLRGRKRTSEWDGRLLDPYARKA